MQPAPGRPLPELARQVNEVRSPSRWRLGEHMAKGATAHVYEGVGLTAPYEGREVAIKITTLDAVTVDPSASPIERWTGRHAEEMDQRVSRLWHPNLIRVYAAGNDECEIEGVKCGDEIGHRYSYPVVMERADGAVAYRQEHMWAQTAPVVMSVLGALSEMHRAGFIHRDVKPRNVLAFHDAAAGLTYKLCDFSLSVALDGLGENPARALFSGSPSYMAPEQCLKQWQEFGPWTDIYGLGCLVWNLLKGCPTCDKLSAAKAIERQCREPLPRLAGEVETVTKALDDWIQWCTEKRIGDRPQSAQEAARALLPLLPHNRVRPRIYLTRTDVAAGGPIHPALPPDDGDNVILSIARDPSLLADDIIAGNVLMLTPRRGEGPDKMRGRLWSAVQGGALLPGHLRCGQRTAVSRVHVRASRRRDSGWHTFPTGAHAWDGDHWFYEGAVPASSTLVCDCPPGPHRCHMEDVAMALAESGWAVTMDGEPWTART